VGLAYCAQGVRMRSRLALTLALAIGWAWTSALTAEDYRAPWLADAATYWDSEPSLNQAYLATYAEQCGMAPRMAPGFPGLQQGFPEQGCMAPCGPTDPRWTARAEAAFMERVGGRPYPLITAGGNELLNVTDLNFSVEVGPRVNLIRHGDNGWDLEVGYFGIDGFTASAYRSDPVNALQFAAPNFVAVIFPDGGTMRFDYWSRLYTIEANVRNRFNHWLTILAGFRWAQLHEELQGGFYAPPPVDVNVPFWQTNVDNHLYGFQFGAEGRILDRGNAWIEAVAKAALCGNHATQDTGVPLPTPPPGASAVGSRAALLAEVGLTAVWQPREHLAWRIGYRCMWLDGVALAPNQIPFTDVVNGLATLDAAGTVFFHGAVGGVEIRY